MGQYMIRKVCFFGQEKMRFMQTESVLQTKNRSGQAKNRFSVALSRRQKKLLVASVSQKSRVEKSLTSVLIWHRPHERYM